MTEEKKKEERQKNRNYKAKKRLGMTMLEKNLMREKDRLRKTKEREEKKLVKEEDLCERMKEGEFKHRGEYNQAKDKRYTTGGSWKREVEINPSFHAQYNAFEKRKERKKR